MTSLRALAEAALVLETGAASVVRQCASCGSSEHGRPVLVGSDLCVSIAYAEGAAVVAWGTGPIGIDLERAGATAPDGLTIAAWTRLEALGKADGTGLRGWPNALPTERPTFPLDLPPAYVGTIAGVPLGWRLLRD